MEITTFVPSGEEHVETADGHHPATNPAPTSTVDERRWPEFVRLMAEAYRHAPLFV